MKISRTWLQEYFEGKLPSIEELDQKLALHAFETEGIEGDVIDIDVLPNRAGDCLSYRGIAREVSVLFGIPMRERTVFFDEDASLVSDIAINNPAQCRRLTSRRIHNLEKTPSPERFVELLSFQDMNSHGPIVDATNIAMFDLGNPIHAFDADKITGTLVARNAKEGEVMTALDGTEVTLDSSMLVIADDVQVLALAGIKGGTAAEIDESTTNIILEVANYEPHATRSTSQKVGIRTDASKRFENDVTPDIAREALDFVTHMIVETCGGRDTVIGVARDIYPEPEKPKVVTLDSTQVTRVLGIDISAPEIEGIFDRFGWSYSGSWDITIPTYRRDLSIPEEVIEEIGRVYGYDKLEAVLPNVAFDRSVNKRYAYELLVRDALIKLGFSDVKTYAFGKKGDVVVANPVASNKGALRKNLKRGLEEALALNVSNAELFGTDTVKLFEIGTVFGKENEDLVLGLAVMHKSKAARKSEGTEQDIIKAALERVQEILGVADLASRELTSMITEISLGDHIASAPDITTFDAKALGASTLASFTPYSTYPFALRDISLWTPSGTPRDVVRDTIMSKAGELAIRADCFDEFTKDDRTSYAFRIVFQAPDRTLTDEELLVIMQSVETAMANEGYEVR